MLIAAVFAIAMPPTNAPDPDPEPARFTPPPEPLPHHGFVLELGTGVIGCIGRLCRRHNAQPSGRVHGMIGGNLRGWVDLGIQGGWGHLRSRVPAGVDGLALYGIDADRVPDEVKEMLDLDRFRIERARLDTAQVGFAIRVHFIPAGRLDPRIGTGYGWQLLRTRYELTSSHANISYHGMYVPAQVGFNVFLAKNIAVGLQFDYVWVRYVLMNVSGSLGRITIPVAALDRQATIGGIELCEDLPQLWSLSAILRTRFGR
jgi:hypothetical protein